jgi:hypothetical protein
VSAVPEHVVENLNNDKRNESAGNGNGEDYSSGLLAVHGGEMNGRPKVSGMCKCGGIICILSI